jgi:DNA-binding Lrp family transcriptional regulator
LDKEIGVPAQRIAMRRIREVLRLKQECELSYGQIAQALRISKGTVANYLSLAEAAGISHSVALGLDDATLLGRLYPKRYVYHQFALPDFAQVHRELKRKGVTLQLLWEEYREAAQGVAYSRSRFYERYVAFVGTLKRSMRQTHVAGEKLFVDFAGPTVPILTKRQAGRNRAPISSWPSGERPTTPTSRPPRRKPSSIGSARTSTRSASSAGVRPCWCPISRGP